MRTKSILEKTLKHVRFGLVKILEAVPGKSRKVKALVVDRGPGWNEFKQDYTGVKKPGGWMRGQNHCFGREIEVNKSDLIP